MIYDKHQIERSKLSGVRFHSSGCWLFVLLSASASLLPLCHRSLPRHTNSQMSGKHFAINIFSLWFPLMAIHVRLCEGDPRCKTLKTLYSFSCLQRYLCTFLLFSPHKASLPRAFSHPLHLVSAESTKVEGWYSIINQSNNALASLPSFPALIKVLMNMYLGLRVYHKWTMIKSHYTATVEMCLFMLEIIALQLHGRGKF